MLNIDKPDKIELDAHHEELLAQIFSKENKVHIQKEFGNGFSDSRVFLIRSYDQQGYAKLPVVVKLASAAIITQEWHAFSTQILERLPGFVAILDKPAQTTDGIYQGIRYGAVGDGIFDVASVAQYSQDAAIPDLWHVLNRRIFRQFHILWDASRRRTQPIQSTYDRFLPVNFSITPMPIIDDAHRDYYQHYPKIDAGKLAEAQIKGAKNCLSSLPDLSMGAPVRLTGFVVTEVEERRITLDLPKISTLGREGEFALSYRIRFENVHNPEAYHVGETVAFAVGGITQTRQTQLSHSIDTVFYHRLNLNDTYLTLPTQKYRVPNPLHRLSEILQETRSVYLSTVHGDLNLENIIIDPDARSARIIDCANARYDHVLQDLLKMETETITHLLPRAFFQSSLQPDTIFRFYRYLHVAGVAKAMPEGEFSIPADEMFDNELLVKYFIMLVSIRQRAKEYMVNPSDWHEYYCGLICTLLGTLKFTNLDNAEAGHEPKAIAFWGAATILWILEEKPETIRNIETGWTYKSIFEFSESRTAQNIYLTIDQRSGGTYFSGPTDIDGGVVSANEVNDSTVSQASQNVGRSSSKSSAFIESDDEDIEFLNENLAKQKQNWRTLMLQKANYAAGEEPLHLLNQIDAANKEIAEIRSKLGDQ
ncbi:MAG: phosphotransferase [Chloroflexota bacterium]